MKIEELELVSIDFINLLKLKFLILLAHQLIKLWYNNYLTNLCIYNMKLVKKPMASKTPKNSYHITILYSHGDADSESSQVHKLNNKSEEQIIKFITRFNEVAKAIDDHRSYDVKLPDYIDQSTVQVEDMEIVLELDHHYSNGDEYYAEMEIDKFVYYDDNGKAFKVEIQE